MWVVFFSVSVSADVLSSCGVSAWVLAELVRRAAQAYDGVFQISPLVKVSAGAMLSRDHRATFP